LRGGGEREGAEWVVKEEWGQGGEMTQALYAHMNKKKKKKQICLKQHKFNEFKIYQENLPLSS
jgi:hypothetical protein